MELSSIGISVASGVVVSLLVHATIFFVGTLARKREIKFIKLFFVELEDMMKKMQNSDDGRLTKEMARFVMFESGLREALQIISIRSRHLTDSENFELHKLVSQKLGLVNMIKEATEGVASPEYKLYDQFFERLRESKWM